MTQLELDKKFIDLSNPTPEQLQQIDNGVGREVMLWSTVGKDNLWVNRNKEPIQYDSPTTGIVYFGSHDTSNFMRSKAVTFAPTLDYNHAALMRQAMLETTAHYVDLFYQLEQWVTLGVKDTTGYGYPLIDVLDVPLPVLCAMCLTAVRSK